MDPYVKVHEPVHLTEVYYSEANYTSLESIKLKSNSNSSHQEVTHLGLAAEH